MADQYIQVPVDSGGKKVRTMEKTIGANTVQAQFWTKDGLALRAVDNGAGQIYVAEAIPGTTDATAGWRIKLVDSSTSPTTIKWADGTDAFTKIWDDGAGTTYLSYTYS